MKMWRPHAANLLSVLILYLHVFEACHARLSLLPFTCAILFNRSYQFLWFTLVSLNLDVIREFECSRRSSFIVNLIYYF